MLGQPISPTSNTSSMQFEEPLKSTRRRASTFGFASPPPRSVSKLSCQLTTDTFKSLGKYYNNGKDIDEVFFDGALEKLAPLNFGRFLDLHGIQEKFRAKMIDWMFEVLTIYQQRDSTIFKSIFLMDMYYSNKREPVPLNELHLLGIVCMMIASKSEEVKYIKLDAFINTIGRGKFSKEVILAKEVKVLSTINFRTSFTTIYELMRCAFRNLDVKDSRALFEKSALLLAKMCLCSYEIVSSLSIKEIALSCIIISLKLSEKLANFGTSDWIKKTLIMFEMTESPVISNKIQMVHKFVMDFSNIMPYVKNIESFEDFMDCEM